MILEDFVMMGKTVPEANGDGRVFVCSAGWSDELKSLVRIYPLAMANAPKMWSINRVALERNSKDARRESWKLKGDRSEAGHCQINTVFEVVGHCGQADKERISTGLKAESIADLNERRASLGIIQPDQPPRVEFSERVESDHHPQMWLFDEPKGKQLGAKRFPYQPRLKFSCASAFHDLQCRDWGSYEWMRKNDYDGRGNHPLKAKMATQPPLLVGNMNRHRNVWLVIAALQGSNQPDLFSEEQ